MSLDMNQQSVLLALTHSLCTQRELIKKTAKKRKLVLGQMESFNGKAGNWGGEEQGGVGR